MRTSLFSLFGAGSVILLSTCSKDPMLFNISNLNGNKIGLVGHGGMGIKGKDPISSLPSLSCAFDMGADAVEMDVQMTSDSVLFVFHNEELDVSTNCSGRIPEKNASEFSCEYKGLVRSKGIRVLSLEETLNGLNPAANQFYVFDCKVAWTAPVNVLQGFVNSLLRSIEAHGLQQRCFIESTNRVLLNILKKKDPQLKLFIYRQNFDESLLIASEDKLFGITMDMGRITAEQVQEAHKAGLRVALFNQKTEKENLTAISMSPDFIQTDKLKHLLKIFEKYRK